MANTKLTASQMSTLARIAAAGDTGRKYLIRERGYHLNSVAGLERLGLVRATGEWVGDKHLYITEAGRAALETK